MVDKRDTLTAVHAQGEDSLIRVTAGFCPQRAQWHPHAKKRCITHEFEDHYVDECPCGYLASWKKTPPSQLRQPKPRTRAEATDMRLRSAPIHRVRGMPKEWERPKKEQWQPVEDALHAIKD